MKSSTLGIVAWVIFGTGGLAAVIGVAWMAGGPPESLAAGGGILAIIGAVMGASNWITETEKEARKK